MNPPLTIRIKKNTDGSAVLTCTRADGTVTWQRQQGARGQFFPRHDLTHFAVETMLRHGNGFYGLVAAGWDISDFGPPWPRGRLPEDMDPSELIVGFLDSERASGSRWTAEDFNDKARIYYEDHRLTTRPPSLTDDDLVRVRQRRAELFAEWDEIAAGEALELRFSVDDPPDVRSTPAGDRRTPQHR